LTVLGQLLTNNFPNSQTSSKCNTRQSKTENTLLTSSADSSNRAASGKPTYITQSFAYGPWYGNGTEAILHIKSHCSAPIFLKLLFQGKTAYPNPNPDVQLLYNATLRKQHVSHGLSRSYWILKLTNVACHPWAVYKLLGPKATRLHYIGCQVKACVCENWGKPRRERRRREGEITLEFVVAISQACMFQILTKNLLFILQSTFFSDLCTKHSQVSSYELVIESEYHFLNEKCVKHCFSVSD